MRLPRLPELLLVTAVAGCNDEGPTTPNTPPTATFGIRCSRLVCTATNGSRDTDGTIAAYVWDFGDETEAVTTKDATHTYATAGQFTVALTVRDDDGAASTAEVHLSVDDANRVPTAGFRVTCGDLVCTFTDQSTDPDGTLALHRWEFGDSSAAVFIPNPTHSYARPGSYTVRLTVRDTDGDSATTEALATTTHTNAPPQVGLGFSCIGLTCDFTDASFDFDGSVMGYLWDFQDGTTSSDSTPRHTFPSAGAYAVRLTATDDSSATASNLAFVLVPLDFEVACAGTECTFTPLNIVGWHIYWQFGDGEGSVEATPTHVYNVREPTSYTVTLGVYDDNLDGYVNMREISVGP